MSVPLTLEQPEAGLEIPVHAASTQQVPAHMLRKIVGGTTALGVATVVERGASFLANVLAARFGGASVFGAYSLGISTANNISTYAAGGIGATAARFSGKYPYAGTGYAALARSLAIITCVSAGIAALALWAGALPLAEILHKKELAHLLRWAAISAAGTIVLESARGLFVGQRKLLAIVLLSIIVGTGMVLLIPAMASTHQPTKMLVAQGSVTLGAVAICLLMARGLGLVPIAPAEVSLALGPILREVWSFGLVQLSGMIAANLAGWWLTALIVRNDSTLVQISFFAIASQLRNLAGLAPGLLTEGSYAVLADPIEEHRRTPQRVMALCAFGCTFVALLVASTGMVLMPWLLPRVYGMHYVNAVLVASIGLATAVVHMGNAPVAARLTVVSIGTAGLINTVWAVFVGLTGSVLFLHRGNAALAMSIFFAAHIVSAALVLRALFRKDHLPEGLSQLFFLCTLIVTSLSALSVARAHESRFMITISVGMFVVAVTGLYATVRLARKHGLDAGVSAFPSVVMGTMKSMKRSAAARETRNLYGS